MGSIGAMSSGSASRYFQKNHKDKSKFVPEGVEGRVEYKGSVSRIIYQLQGGLRSSMGYIGAKKLNEIPKKAKFVKITKAGFYESMVHSVEMTQKTFNYKL
jgi:IMP dehydrogenase